MTASQAISAGLRGAARSKGIVSLFFLSNLLLAAAVAAPMHWAIARHLDHSLAGNELARGFSAAWLTEFQLADARFLRGFSITIVYGGILFLLLNAVLAAGAFEVFFRGEGAGMHAFGRGVGKFWGRFLFLTAIASLFYFVLFWFWDVPAAHFNDWLFRNAVREGPHFYLDWLRWALLFFTVAVVSAIVDYARADLVRDQPPWALAAFGHAAGFVVARFRQVMAIYLALGLLAALAVLAYAAFARYFPQSSVLTVLVWFLVAQVLLWVRWLLRLASWAAAAEYYQAYTAPRQPVTSTLAEIS